MRHSSGQGAELHRCSHHGNKGKRSSETFSEHRVIKLVIKVYKTRKKQKEDFPKRLTTGKTPKRQQTAPSGTSLMHTGECSWPTLPDGEFYGLFGTMTATGAA